MKTELAADVWLVSGILSESECQALIDRAEAIGFQQADVLTPTGPKRRTDIRNNDRLEWRDAELAASLWKQIEPFVPPVLEGGTAVGLDDNFRIYRYVVGQRFKTHRDGVVRRSSTVRSRLSCLFYLNGGMEGGETVFYSDSLIERLDGPVATVRPQAGDALLFRHEWWHEGRPILGGRKYVLRTDIFFQFPEPSSV